MNPPAPTELLPDDPVRILRGWAKAYRDNPQHRFPSDPNAEFFPVDLETAANEIERLRQAASVGAEEDSYKRGFKAGYEVCRGNIAKSVRALVPPVEWAEVSGEAVTAINARLTDLAEANALYGKDQRLSAPDKIARNEREISWLKDLRSMIALGAAPKPKQ